MRIAAQELNALLPEGEDDEHAENDRQDAEHLSPYLTVDFSPWQYEDHDDVKIALMTAVLDTIAVRVPEAAEQVSKLRAIVAGMRRWGAPARANGDCCRAHGRAAVHPRLDAGYGPRHLAGGDRVDGCRRQTGRRCSRRA